MATQAVTSGAKKNDGGVAAYANAKAGSRITGTVGYAQLGSTHKPTGVPGPETNATIAAGTDTAGTFKPLAAGTFAGQQPRQFVMQGGTKYLANTAFANGIFTAADWGTRRYPKPVTTVRTINIIDWSRLTGLPTAEVEHTEDFGADNAATPTRSVPGELVYMATGATPKQDDYKPITG